MINTEFGPIGTPSHNKENKIIAERIEEAKNPNAKIVTSNFTREQPDQVTFRQLINYHDRTPQLQIAVGSYSELITGTELNVTCKSDEATKLLNEWIRQTNFYEKFENLVSTLLICGNALLEKLDENDITDVVEVDMATIISKKRDEFGNLLYYEQRTQNGNTEELGKGKLGKFVEFNLTNYSRQPWGKSLFHSLAVPRTVGNRTTLPLVEIMWMIEDAMGAIIVNNAYPITTITYPSANDAYLEKEAIRWQRFKPGDKRVQKIKPEIEFFETQGNSKYTDYINHIEKAFELGTQFPHDIMTGDFTSRASSDTTETIVQKRTRGFQRYLCEKIKVEIFDNVLTQNGFDAELEETTCQFTTQNVIELDVTQVKDLTNTSIMTKMEAREWLRDNTGMELPDDDIIQQEDEEKKLLNKQQVFDKAKDIKKEALKGKVVCKMCKEGQHAFCSKRRCQCR